MRADDILMTSLELVGGRFLNALMTTLNWRLIDGYKDHANHVRHGPVIWAFWHGHLVFPAYIGRHRRVRILISQHRDGEIVARVAKGIGYDPVRGSTSKGASEALAELTATSASQDMAITPDGPVGPREIAQAGTVFLAQVMRRPIMPVAASAYPCVHLHSWDRFTVPLPFARAAIMIGDVIQVPANASSKKREECRLRLENELKRMTLVTREACRSRRPLRRYARHPHPYSDYDRQWTTSR